MCISSLPLAFLTPGICPFVCQFAEADTADSIFSQIRVRRPQILQRLYSLVENFGLRCCLIFIDVLAMNFPPYFANGILNCLNNSRASSSVLGCCNKDYIHTSYFVDLIVLDLRENQLLFDSKCVVSSSRQMRSG